MLLLDREFMQTLEQLTLLCRQHLSGTVGTNHRSRNRGPGLEFADYRRYSFGDDPRFLDWNAYLRLGKLFLKIYQIEEHIPVRVLLDCSNSMDCGAQGAAAQAAAEARGAKQAAAEARGAKQAAAEARGAKNESKFLYARRLAAAFAYLALLRLDTSVIVPFSESMGRPLVAGGGRDRFWPLLRFLSELRCEGRTNLLRTVKQFLSNFPARGEAIIISDFFDESLAEGTERAVEMLRAAGHDFILVQMHTAEEQRPTEFGQLELEDTETGAQHLVESSPAASAAYERAFMEFSDGLERLALRNAGRYARATTAVPYQEFILGALRHDRVVA